MDSQWKPVTKFNTRILTLRFRARVQLGGEVPLRVGARFRLRRLGRGRLGLGRRHGPLFRGRLSLALGNKVWLRVRLRLRVSRVRF